MANHRDPKQIITPYAFRIAPELLGLPLAGPWRRAAAMAVDLALIGILVLLKEISGTLFGLLLAWVLFRISSRSAGALRGAPRLLARASAAIVLLVSLGSFVGSCLLAGPTPSPPAGSDGADADDVAGDAGTGVAGRFSLAELGRGVSDVATLRSARSAETARPAAERLARTLSRAGASPSEVEEALSEILATGGSQPWRDSLVRSVVVGTRRFESARAADADSLARRLAEALAGGDSLEAAVLRERLAAALSADRIASLQEESRRLREERDRARREAEEDEGILSFLRRLADDLGLGFGWAGLYFTVFLALWKGRTPGKRLLGLRVIRLSGDPLGWWPAFERFGGYAASLATGLLGFFQILWDANRQGVHDKIVGTVVVLDTPEVHRAAERAARPRDRPGRGVRDSPEARRAPSGARR